MSVSDIAVGLLGDHRRTDEDCPEVTEEYADGIALVAPPAAANARPGQAEFDAVPATRTPAMVLRADVSDFRRWSRRYIRALLGVDAFVGIAAIVLAARFANDIPPHGAGRWLLLGLIGAAWPLWLGSTQGYQHRRIGAAKDELIPVLRAAAIVIILCALGAAWFGLPRLLSVSAIAAPTAALGSVGFRVISRQRLQYARRLGSNLRRTILVGSPEAVQDLHGTLARERHAGMQVSGVCVPAQDWKRAQQMGLPVVGDIDHVADAATQLDCHAVTVTGTDASRPNLLRHLAWSLENVDAELLIHPGLGDVARFRMHIQAYPNLPLLHITQPRIPGWQKMIKRATDLLLTTVGLLFISPVLLAIVVAIKVDDRRAPAIFRQQRIGIDGQPFTMYKFRTMVTDAESRLAQLQTDNQGAGPLFKMHHDPRVTKIGGILRRYSLDELPQLFNVLFGSMSLVGPRPALQSEVETYTLTVHRRLKVAPGLTGLWQISGRSLLSWEDAVRLDLRYVENWSVGLDLLILAKTTRAILAKEGAF